MRLRRQLRSLMEELLMEERQWFSSPNMGQMLNECIGMTTEIGVIGGEAVVEVEEGIMRVVVAVTEIIGTGADAAVEVLVTTKTAEEANRMMRGVVQVHLMGVWLCELWSNDIWYMFKCLACGGVPVLEGAHLHTDQHLLMVQVQMHLRHNDRSPTPKSVSPRCRRADSRSPSPRSDADE